MPDAMRVLVTGANGLVGSRLCALLAARGYQVVGCSRGPQRTSATRQSFSYRTCELSREPEVTEVFDFAKPEVVIHTASMTDVDGCERDPALAYACNVTASANVAAAARRDGSHLIHVSTDYIFDGVRGPYTEEDVPNPKGTYATTKYLGEQAVRILAASLAIARTAVVYGWPPAGRPNFGSWLVSSLAKGQTVRLFEDQWVSPSLADSVAAMLAEVAERKHDGIWNICGDSVVNRVTFGRAVCELFGFDPALLIPIKLKDANMASPRPQHSGLVADKARRELKEKPLRLPDALSRFHAAWANDVRPK